MLETLLHSSMCVEVRDTDIYFLLFLEKKNMLDIHKTDHVNVVMQLQCIGLEFFP